jgi:hypothetical protein
MVYVLPLRRRSLRLALLIAAGLGVLVGLW